MFKNILNFILFIILLPIIIIRIFLMNGRVDWFLAYGRAIIGGYDGKLKIGTNSNNVIYENNNFNGFNTEDKNTPEEMPIALRRMNVYNYWIDDDGYLFIKVFYNEKKLKKMYKSDCKYLIKKEESD